MSDIAHHARSAPTATTPATGHIGVTTHEEVISIHPRSRFLAVPASQLPPGQLVHVTDVPGELTVRMLDTELTKELAIQLDEWHHRIFNEGLLVQQYADLAQRRPQPRIISRWVAVPQRVLPTGRLCWPIQDDPEWRWLIHEHHITERLLDEMNRVVEQHMADGHWNHGA